MAGQVTKLSAPKRVQGARETILSGLTTLETSQSDIYAYCAARGFPNRNTIRGRLSELVNEGTVIRRSGWHIMDGRYRLPLVAAHPAVHQPSVL